jgi:general secretion pathway protein M
VKSLVTLKVSRFGWTSGNKTAFSLPHGRSGKILALGLLLVVLGTVWAAIVSPLLDLHAARAVDLARQQARASEMASLLRNVPELRQRASAALANGPPPDAMLQGTTDAVAGAILQQLVRDMATQAGVSLSSTEALAVEQMKSYRLIGLRISLTTPWSVLVQLLQTIEQAKPVIMVDDLQLQGPRLLLANRDPPVEASMTVLAFRAGTAPEGGK